MEFNSNKAIYLQIADNICEQILSDAIRQGDRIPSVREWGASIGVNPNTVARSYETLTDQGVIFNKRGIGFFVSDDAKDAILRSHRQEFIEQELPVFLKKAQLLGLDLKDYIK